MMMRGKAHAATAESMSLPNVLTVFLCITATTNAFVAQNARTKTNFVRPCVRSLDSSVISPRNNKFRRRSVLSSSKLQLSLRPPPPKKETRSVGEDLDDDLKEDIAKFDPFHFEGQGEANFSQPTSSLERQIEDSQNDEEDGKIGIWAARGLLLVVAMLFGTNFASVKYLETLCFHPPCNHPPSEAALARFGVAALVSLPLLVNQRKDVIFGGLECGLWITLGYIAQAVALETVPSGKVAFVCSLTVVIVPLISSLVFGTKFKMSNAISAALALSGVGVLEGLVDVNSILGIPPAVADATSVLASAAPDVTAAAGATSSALASAAPAAAESTGWLASVASSLGLTKGDLLTLGQPLGFGFSFLRIEHYVEKFKDVENRIVTISAAQCVAVGVLSLLWVLIDFHGHVPNFGYMLEPHRIGAIAWTGIMTTVVAIYIEGIALQTASATEAALTFASEPVWAALFGSLLLREKLNANAYVGGAVILAACLVSAISDLRGEQAKQEHEEIEEIVKAEAHDIELSDE